MLPSSAKQKGRLLQQKIVKDLLALFPQLEPDDVKSTSMGAAGEDVQLSPAARKLFNYQVECKSKATSQLHTYYKQAKSHGDREPIVLVKMDRDVVLAAVSWEHFQKLITKE
jgi:hypothetical protein